MDHIRKEYRKKFEEALENLNPEQRLAVETIEGPVMTIAGPGTGKTELLALRIGNILRKTDAGPHNILCLTYTDAGSKEMRNRLLKFIGPEAYHVTIDTFHAFCNTVIRENMQDFGYFRDLQPVSDLEKVDILRELIDQFDHDNPLKRYKTDVYFEARRMNELYQTMKQENWTGQTITQAVENHIARISDPVDVDPDFRCGRSYFDDVENRQIKVGDVSPKKVRGEKEKYNTILAAANDFDRYNALLTQRERYDYHDMILWVIDRFRHQDNLLGKYQERYHYILVDEYQDTNGAQNELLFLLASYWDSPNLFIVGDDDQSIFRFQGANINNIIEFEEKFTPAKIVLTRNYRSTQPILDAARKLIENNEHRLVNKFSNLSKELIASHKDRKGTGEFPQITKYATYTEEEAGIMRKIKHLHDTGTQYSEIAIIYPKHQVAENLLAYCAAHKIPVNVKKRVNVLTQPLVRHLVNILQYIHAEHNQPYSGEAMLFELLHYHYFELSPSDIGRLSRQCGSQKLHADEENESYFVVHWRDAMQDLTILKNAGITNADGIIRVQAMLENWIQEYSNVTLQMLVEKILTDGKIMEYVLKHPNAAWHLELINTFFDFVKDESVRNPEITAGDLLLILEKMKENALELPVQKIVSSADGIHFMTAHGSKGLEFKHVFLIRSNQNFWEDKKGPNNRFAYPPTLYASSKVTETEDVRRLFFVAVTRAQTNLYISYNERNDDDKMVMPSVFLTEIFNETGEIKSVLPDLQDVIEYKASTLQLPFTFRQLIDIEEVNRILENFRISATSLNKYLECPLAFYFEKILRVPMARSVAMGYGNAVHYAFEMFFRDIKKSQPRSQGSMTLLLDLFEKGMKKFRSHFTASEFERYLFYGQQVLTAYYEEYNESWLAPADYEIEYAIKDVEHMGVPISGKLDKVSIYSDHILVTDYKTGKPDSAKLQPPKPEKQEDRGGDYWRQVVFYSLLIEGDKRKNWKLKNAVMDFVEKHDQKFHQKNFSISEDDKAIVSAQLTDTYQKIKNHDFNPGCGSEKCRWCSFVKYDILEKEVVVEIVDDDQEV